MKVLPILLSDSYKQWHYKFYPEGITLLFSNMTPRSFKHLGTDKAVFFGLQYYLKEYLIEQWNHNFFDQDLELVLTEYKRFHKNFSFADIDTDHIEKLHKLGYLPLEIKALPEGSKVNAKVPFYTIVNTHSDHAWLVNFLETQMSTVIWDLCVIATIGYQYRTLLDKWAIKTTGSIEGVQWQGHDFSMRGRSSVESTFNQAGWLLSFNGTDTIPAVLMLEEYYGANIEKELVGSSVPASEHSCMTAYGKENEIDAFRRILTQFPTGIVSVVSDSFDLWNVCTDFVTELKEEIINRNGKLVIRPDSGDPCDIICGDIVEEIKTDNYNTFLEIVKEILHDNIINETPHGEFGGDINSLFKFNGKVFNVTYAPDWNRYDKQYYYIDNYGGNIKSVEVTLNPSQIGVIELLWNVFGGTINEQGYKVLDSHIGAIYGDSINLKRANDICERLEKKGFASTNIVYGVGSFTFNMNSRDSLGIAVKSTYCEVQTENGLEQREIFKDPITDDGIKKSAKGLLVVHKNNSGEYILKDQVSWDEVNSDTNELKTVFLNGKLFNEQKFSEIKQVLTS